MALGITLALKAINKRPTKHVVMISKQEGCSRSRSVRAHSYYVDVVRTKSFMLSLTAWWRFPSKNHSMISRLS